MKIRIVRIRDAFMSSILHFEHDFRINFERSRSGG